MLTQHGRKSAELFRLRYQHEFFSPVSARAWCWCRVFGGEMARPAEGWALTLSPFLPAIPWAPSRRTTTRSGSSRGTSWFRNTAAASTSRSPSWSSPTSTGWSRTASGAAAKRGARSPPPAVSGSTLVRGPRGRGSFLGGCLVHISTGGVSDSYFSTHRGVSWGFPDGPAVETELPRPRGMSLIPSRRAEVTHATQPEKKKKSVHLWRSGIKPPQWVIQEGEQIKKDSWSAGTALLQGTRSWMDIIRV